MDDFRFQRLEQYRVGGSGDKMELRMPLPKTPDGKVNQRCPGPRCRPAVFQLGNAPEERPQAEPGRLRRLPGPGQTICPYCGHMAADEDFIAPEDMEAIKKQIAWAAEREVADFLKDTARDFNRRTPRSGFISVRMDVKDNFRPRPTPWREDLLRDLVCHLCGRRYGVYAIALFCPDCGGPNLATHFSRELALVTRQIEVAEQLRGEGKRELAYRLLGNAHEDVLTALETCQKTVFSFLVGERSEASEELRKKLGGNWFQNIYRARRAFAELGFDPFENLREEDLAFLELNIEKRHVVGHNLSVANEIYAEATQDEQPGRTVQLLAEEILAFAAICGQVIQHLDDRLPRNRASCGEGAP